MYRKLLFISFAICGLATSSFSQCETCIENKDENSFCYQNENFEGYCILFTDGSPTIKLSKGKKSKTIPVTSSYTLKDLVTLSQNKKLKISAQDMLFIQEGLKVWVLESRKLGYEYTDTGLGIKMLKQGDGALPKKGQRVKVHYTGYLENGKKFDSSVDRDQPFAFNVGQGRVIDGWDEGVVKLNIGSKALLKIPPKLAYGSRGAGGAIPPNATLYFEIEVLEVE